MSMVLTAVEHLNQAKAEATDSERCAIKTEETGTPGTANEEGANTFTSVEEISSIRSASVSNASFDSGSMAFGSGEADIGDGGSIILASGNAHQQAGSITMASSSIQRKVILPRRPKMIPTDLCATEGGKGNADQDGEGHTINKAEVSNNDRQVGKNIDKAAVQNSDCYIVGHKVQNRKTSDRHNSDDAGVMTNPDSSAGIRSKDMDNSTETGVTRKRNAEDSSNKSRKKGTAARTKRFEGRFKQLIDFIDEFGHCNVPVKYSVDPSLGQWCINTRCAYKKIQQGQTTDRILTQDQIERLEEIGFKWNAHETFEQRCHDLKAFKSQFGHCNVPWKYSVDPSLGQWCSTTRCAYNKIQQGKTPKRNLTQDQMERLEEIGFKWKLK